VESTAPLGVRAQWEADDAWRTAQLRNISAGGAALVAGFYYETGEALLLQLRPAEYLPKAALAEGEDFEARAMAATVLETRKVSDELCLYRVEFRDVSPDDRRYLVRVVQKLQLYGQEKRA
jgi:c-di-GMP-binding flagellar brake protein YcgR